MKRGGKRAGAGRPKGARKKTTADLMDAAKVYTAEALDTFVAAMRSGETHAIRAAAADKILDRGYGKAPQALNVEQRVTHDLSAFSDAQLAAIIAGSAGR